MVDQMGDLLRATTRRFRATSRRDGDDGDCRNMREMEARRNAEHDETTRKLLSKQITRRRRGPGRAGARSALAPRQSCPSQRADVIAMGRPPLSDLAGDVSGSPLGQSDRRSDDASARRVGRPPFTLSAEDVRMARATLARRAAGTRGDGVCLRGLQIAGEVQESWILRAVSHWGAEVSTQEQPRAWARS